MTVAARYYFGESTEIGVIDRLRIAKDVRGLGGTNRDSAHNIQ